MSRLRIVLISLPCLALVAVAAMLLWKDPPARAPEAASAAILPETPAGVPSGDRPALYRCPMHPDIVRDEPGNCPICGMDLAAVRDVKPESARPRAAPRDGAVRVSRSFLQNFAVRTAEVERGPLTISTRAVGVLAHDEAKLVSVNTKFAGWIEEARGTQRRRVGGRGRRALRGLQPGGGDHGARIPRGGGLRQAAPGRGAHTPRPCTGPNRCWRRPGSGSATGTSPKTRSMSWIPWGRRRAGYASWRPPPGSSSTSPATPWRGCGVSPGQTVIKIADHSTLWAKADFDEEALPHIREGSPVSVEMDAFPERRWEGRILFFRSAVNPETRALTAFVEVANPDLALRPMMDVTVFANHLVSADAVLVPVESVLHSGERAIVVVARDDGMFEPRSVELGPAAGDRQQVTAGLFPGESVVVSSQFLIDSESNLRAAVGQLLGEAEARQPAARPHRH